MTNDGDSSQRAGGGDGGSPPGRAVIVGAGIAGLATALRLHRAGWETLVVERAPARRRGGYMVNLVGWGYDAAERLGLVPALSASDIGLFSTVLVRADGRRKFSVPPEIARAALGDRALTVFRENLESALYEAVRGSAVLRFGTTAVDVAQDADGVRVGLSDGTTERADLLVGADGLRSGVRAAVFGPEADFRVDLDHVVGALPLDRLPEDVPEGTGTTFIGPGRTAAVVNLGPGRSSAFFAYRCADPDAELARGPVRALTSAFGDLGGGVPDVLRQLRADPSGAYFDSVSQVRADRWSRGRVVLLGDAAWCPSLFAGYGAALALSGADRLGDALERHGGDVTGALARWEAGLRPETRRRQALARRGTRQYAPSSRAHVWMNDLAIRAVLLPGVRGLVQRRIRRAGERHAAADG
ncbi:MULTISPECIES: FAD-dependent oxidoreductase [Nocardiopsis]|uniref:FAD dependent oxidoreductase n=1 Tax=Nocardiopsis dassonvillei (strain ATCC 23218 / DSM 43111 / CIP 107115 / JCM 7437 / KCTC 9190 / NBRC 14626 / NCTC 10488 / NRRL B-5397 / IMRU 509) TaxID=446468 RepID=D7AUU0_NOCDD|nr:FAD-dependent oxidoreductase [Nocardiopsis dassonvillei]ADH69490.1 FAD dependent oxidoreductase [Nocardiopsis dassonvillei subsp. dassonvillei DSM 43111]NKY81223.1 NAD(P)-binding protein [Nocardiopsis dassonvillei]VEI90000.1 3-hydroxybenzoate 6-hydroxylase 1 [Nocardiopsis dassonvillei]